MSLHITSCDLSPLLHLNAICGVCKLKPDWFDKEFTSKYSHKYHIKNDYLEHFKKSYDKILSCLQNCINRQWITYGCCEY